MRPRERGAVARVYCITIALSWPGPPPAEAKLRRCLRDPGAIGSLARAGFDLNAGSRPHHFAHEDGGRIEDFFFTLGMRQ